MRTIETNLYDRTRDHCIRIPLPLHRLQAMCIRTGDRVRLSGDDMEVEAQIVFRAGEAVAVPQWSTLTYVD